MKKCIRLTAAALIVSLAICSASVALAEPAQGKIIAASDNVLDSAGEEGTVIAVVRMGDVVTILGTLGNYHHVKTADGKVGYIISGSVGVDYSQEAAANADTIDIEGKTYQKGIVNAKDVALREKADPKSKKVATLKKDTEAGVLAVSGDYYQVITADGKKGYIAKQYLSINGAIVLSQPAVPVQQVIAEQVWTKPTDVPAYELAAEDADLWARADNLAGGARARNSDVLGWIQIPDTNISYPAVIAKDNNYYLQRNAQKQSDKKGAIYFDFRNNDQYQRRQLVLYGHNMSTSKTMFAWLTKYKDADWVNSHPVIKMTAFNGSVWQFVSCYVALPQSQYVKTKFTNDSEWVAYMERLKGQNMHKDKTPNIALRTNDQILTLVTCSYDIKPKGRLYVHFRRVE